MYMQYWGLTTSPFSGMATGSSFCPTAGQTEAIARLDHVIKNRGRCGILTGISGTGKSTILQHLAHRETRRGNVAASISLLGMDASELTRVLAERLGGIVSDKATAASIWRTIFDRIAVHGYQHQATLLFIDDIDQADENALTALGRLAQWQPAEPSGLTLLLGTDPVAIGQRGNRLLELSDLRIELTLWQVDDTRAYFASALQSAGGSSEIFDRTAIDALQKVSGGNPRHLRRLADLALIAGAGQQAQSIDASTIHAVDSQLRRTSPSVAA